VAASFLLQLTKTFFGKFVGASNFCLLGELMTDGMSSCGREQCSPITVFFTLAPASDDQTHREKVWNMPGDQKTIAEMEQLGLPLTVLTFYKGDDDKGDTEEEKMQGVYPMSSFVINDVKEECRRQRRFAKSSGCLAS